MRIEQINLGSSALIAVSGKKRATGIFKEKTEGSVSISKLGLLGDVIVNKKHHGGPDQAVYLYSLEDYSMWTERLDRMVPTGTFGENLTTSGLNLSDICVGDVLQSESVVLQVSAPRIPCSVLAARMNDKQFGRKFMEVGCSGAYCRVLEIGEVKVGDEFAHMPYEGDRIPLALFLKDAHAKLSAKSLERYLAVPIDERSRLDFKKKLAAIS
jgi:MOSC domain-containing protein YiiM